MEQTYNCRLLQYPVGSHVTFYKKTITRKKDIESDETQKETHNTNLSKSFQNENKSEEQAEHCKKVSLSATKNRIYNIARSNIWEWFITLTFNRKNTDSSDYDMIVYRLHTFMSNLQQRKCPNMKYLIVPELHKDNEHYHFHGLLSGVDNLRFCFSGHFDKGGKPIYNITDWTYGFTTATQVQDTQRVASYITKYITKSTEQYLKNKKRYLCSRNIERTEPTFHLMDEEEFVKLYNDNITYAKSVDVKQAHQRINYYEISD